MTDPRRREFLANGARGAAGIGASLLVLSAWRGAAAEGARERIRIGQIGTGHAHASGKMAALRRSPDFQVVGLAEPDPRRRAALRRSRVYRDVPLVSVDELLNVKGLRAVAVETEVDGLLGAAARAVAAGLHVHLDKPAGCSLPRFKALLDDAARRKLTVQMGYMFRYNPAFALCFRAVREGWLGTVFSVHAVISKTLGAAQRAALARQPGGAMFELGCHLLDAVVAVAGKPDRVTAFARHSSPLDDGLVDNQVAVLEYPSATATVRSTLQEVEGQRRRQFVVCGDQGTVDIRPLEPPAVRLTLARPHEPFARGTHEPRMPKYVRYDADFADLARIIRGEKPSDYPPAHDLAVQEAVLRASGLPTD